MKFWSQIILYLIPLLIVLMVLQFIAPDFSASNYSVAIKYSEKNNIKYQLKPPSLSSFQSIECTKPLKQDKDVAYHWFHIQIPELKQMQHPVLVVSPFILNEIKLFTDDNPTNAIAVRKRFDYSKNNFATNQNKVIDLIEYKNSPGFYLQLIELRNTNVDIQAWELTDLLAADLRTNTFFSAILFAIFLMIIINVFFYINIKDKAYLYYILYHSAVLILIFNMSGFLNHYPSLSWIANNYATAIIPLILSSFFCACFVRSFLHTKELTPRLDKFIFAYLIAYPISLILIVVFYSQAIKLYNLINLIALSSVPLYIVTMFVHLKIKNRPAIFFVLSFSILLTFTFVRFMYVGGIIGQSFYAQYGVIVAVLIETIIFSIGLADRVLRLRQQRDNAELEKAKTTFVYNLEKDFNRLVAKINTHIHESEKTEHQQYIIDKFFEEFKDKISVNSNAVIYQQNGKLNTIYDTRHQNRYHFDIIEANTKQIAFIAKSGSSKTIIGRNSRFLVVPVNIKGHEWSACVFELDNSFKKNKVIEGFIDNYASELIRTLLHSESLSKIKAQAEIDNLTGVYNRRGIEAFINHELSRNFNKNQPLSIAFIDFDDFKDINDQYGHHAGDLCLQLLANTFKQSLPLGAQLGRFGGDEFVVVLPETNQFKALNLINRAKNKLQPIEHAGAIVAFSVSIGIASQLSANDTMASLVEQADRALYESKDSGKNTISVA